MKNANIESVNFKKDNALENKVEFIKLFEKCPIPNDQVLYNLGLFTRRHVLAKIFMLNELYKKIVPIHGVICEFGVHWGNNISLFSAMRSIYEPYNWNRKIIGFDTFEGFPNIHEKDGNSDKIKIGEYSTSNGYEIYLENILNYHESEAPNADIKKFELVKGDAIHTVKQYLKDNPETIIAFAYFDFDLYEPTKICLEAILPHLTKGAVIAFDELNYHGFPGETIAFKEVFGINKFKINRDPNNAIPSYIVYE